MPPPAGKVLEQAAATFLGMSATDLHAQLVAGKSPAALATAAGKDPADLLAALKAAARAGYAEHHPKASAADLDAFVADIAGPLNGFITHGLPPRPMVGGGTPPAGAGAPGAPAAAGAVHGGPGGSGTGIAATPPPAPPAGGDAQAVGPPQGGGGCPPPPGCGPGAGAPAPGAPASS